MRSVRIAFFAFALVSFAGGVLRAETIPPKPTLFFNDYAHVVPNSTAQQLNARLTQFERETSNQIVVVIFPRMDSSSSVEDYTARIAQSWHAGQKGRDNGAALFVFVQDHQTYIQVGYGLEPVLTDALCATIVRREINPRFAAGDFAGGLTAGINGMIAASRGEYRGTGNTNAERRGGRGGSGSLAIFAIIILFTIVNAFRSRRQVYRNPGRWGGFPPFGGGSWGGGGFGGGSSGGGGGFSGGGGNFGGGGAGGKW